MKKTTLTVTLLVGALWGADAFAACVTEEPPAREYGIAPGAAFLLCEEMAEAYNVADVYIPFYDGFTAFLVPRDFGWAGHTFTEAVCDHVKQKIPADQAILLFVVSLENLVRSNGPEQWVSAGVDFWCAPN